jgi:hypothetical protein
VSRPDWRFWYESRVLARRSAAALLAAAVLAFPGVALADSAGDNQYQDPFSNIPTQPKQQRKTSSHTQGGTTQSPVPAASVTPSAPVAQSPAQTLPRTGFPLLPVAAIAATLVAAGLALRRLA